MRPAYQAGEPVSTPPPGGSAGLGGPGVVHVAAPGAGVALVGDALGSGELEGGVLVRVTRTVVEGEGLRLPGHQVLDLDTRTVEVRGTVVGGADDVGGATTGHEILLGEGGFLLVVTSLADLSLSGKWSRFAILLVNPDAAVGATPLLTRTTLHA